MNLKKNPQWLEMDVYGSRKKGRLKRWLCEPVWIEEVVVVVGCQKEVIVEGHTSLLALIPDDRVQLQKR